jgi:hypothetical protein
MMFVGIAAGALGLLAEPAMAAGTLQKFSVFNSGLSDYGDGYVAGELQCVGTADYVVSVLVTQGDVTGSGKSYPIDCNGTKQVWQTDLWQDGPIFPGKGRICAIAEETTYIVAKKKKVQKQICRTITFVAPSGP